MKTRPTEITMTPTQHQRWKIEIVTILQIMKLGHKEAEQQTTTRCMKMSNKYTARDQNNNQNSRFQEPLLATILQKANKSKSDRGQPIMTPYRFCAYVHTISNVTVFMPF